MKARPAKAPRVPAHPGLTVLEDEVVWDGRFPLQRVRFRYTRFDGALSRRADLGAVAARQRLRGAAL